MAKKHTVLEGCDFPNLPYLLDGEVRKNFRDRIHKTESSEVNLKKGNFGVNLLTHFCKIEQFIAKDKLVISRSDITLKHWDQTNEFNKLRSTLQKYCTTLVPKLPEPILLWKHLLPLYFFIWFLEPDTTILCTI